MDAKCKDWMQRSMLNQKPSYLTQKYLHFEKQIKKPFIYRGYIMKQYLVVMLVTLAVFLPVRLFFYTYVSQSWLGNLGVMSVIAVVLFILIEKNKLGWFGVYFKNRVRRLVFSRIIWVVVVTSIATIIMYSSVLFAIDLVTSGNNDEEIQFMTAMLVINHTDGTILPDTLELKDLGLYPNNSTLETVRTGLLDGTNSTKTKWVELLNDENFARTLTLLVAVTIHEWNENTGAWGPHFMTVIVIEEIEALGLLVFYRKFYFKKVGVSWQSLGFPKNTKQMVRLYNKKPQKKSEVY